MKKYLLLALIMVFSLPSYATTTTVNKYALSEKQLADFFEKGIIVIPKFFNKAEVKEVTDSAMRLHAEAEKIAKQESGKIMYKGTQIVIEDFKNKPEILRIVWAGAAEPRLVELSRQPKLLVPVSQILGSTNAAQLNNQLHFKFPNGGADLTFYQDIRNRKRFDESWQDLNGKGSFVLSIIALDPMNTKVGTIYYVPKSHTRGDLMLDQIKDPEQLKKVAQLDKAVPLTLNPGDMVLWHPYLIHGVSKPEFTTARKIFINGFAYPGANTRQYPGEGSAQTIDLQ